ncbi:protoporphyrinogen oxidase HemJ [Rhodoblastus sp. 17X3]|uniref:protoporphyrinogen oxidase HemJ n=1 Tax=Rhodoblastus sp. 17X3 TaxID=3047026 RepID=UPI0024B713BB|nr:protoporphyrinogen oxidase HemJ [Rhodoblastus sp. 17X3]MDI9848286.1 protoporphyrinogen oxidase HemJ [Rhodoblastus sp. 17X3]
MYLWIKALHVVSIISWMAGLLYLPRLFVYHSDAELKSIQSETFKVMEKRLAHAIMTPAMVMSWISGLFIAIHSGFYSENWFKIKFILAIFMTVFHFYLLNLQTKFNFDNNRHSNRFYRLINEIPTVLMLLIVGLVILKP